MNFHLHQPSLFENNPKRIQFPKKLNNYSTDSSFIQAFKNPSDIPWKSVVPDKILIFFAVFFFVITNLPNRKKNSCQKQLVRFHSLQTLTKSRSIWSTADFPSSHLGASPPLSSPSPSTSSTETTSGGGGLGCAWEGKPPWFRLTRHVDDLDMYK